MTSPLSSSPVRPPSRCLAGNDGDQVRRIVPPDEWETFTRGAPGRSHYVVQDVDRRAMTEPPRDRDVVQFGTYTIAASPALLGVDLAALRSGGRRSTSRWDRRSRSTSHMAVLGGTGDYVEIYVPVHNVSAGGPGVAFTQIDLFDLADEVVGTSGRDPEIRIVDRTDSDLTPAESGPELWSTRIEVADRIWEVTVADSERPTLPPLTTTVVASGVAITLLATVLTAAVASARSRRRQLDEILDRAQEKDVFLATVAHELRTPLTSVVGGAALLAEQWQQLETDEIEELLQAVHSEASDLSDLIEDFLVAGRLQAGAISYRYETVDIGSQVRRVKARINSLHDFDLRLGEPGPFALADPLRVRQIIRNLLVNANRYARTTVRVVTRASNDRVVAQFCNDGEPVAPELVEVLFEPYQSGRARTLTVGSIGLGLPVSRRLARAMGGDLTYSYEDGWCIFTVELPRAAAPDAESATMDPATATTG